MNDLLQTRISDFIVGLPSGRQIFVRSVWNEKMQYTYDVDIPKYEGKVGSQSVDLTVNYKCHDAFGPQQRVEYLGILITVWHPENCNVARRLVVHPGANAKAIYLAIQRLAGRVRKDCSHKHTHWVRCTGNCLNVYHCDDCGVEFEVDSSD